jgi:type III pantothenate kinase
MQRVLTIDVGNSRKKVGVFQFQAGAAAGLELQWSASLPLSTPWPWDAICDRLGPEPSTVGGLAGSHPGLVERTLQEWPVSLPTPIVIRDSRQLDLKLDVDAPELVGIDRQLNAIAANRRRRPGSAALIVDSGTATTVDVVDSDGIFRGGAILPGLGMAARALHEYTALLPLVRVSDELSNPPMPGRNTQQAIQAGLVWGHVGAINELVARCDRRAIAADSSAAATTHGTALQLFLTGGAAALLAQYFPTFHHVTSLAMEGLAWTAIAQCSKPDVV